MTDTLESYRPRADRLSDASGMDPILLELEMIEVQHDNARLRQIVAELLVKNQILRWELQGKDAGDVQALRWITPVEAA